MLKECGEYFFDGVFNIGCGNGWLHGYFEGKYFFGDGVNASKSELIHTIAALDASANGHNGYAVLLGTC